MINAQGGVLGKKMQLFVQDSQGKPEAGVAAYRRLVSENKVVAVPGFFHSSVAIAVNEVAKDMGVPTLAVQASASTSPPSITTSPSAPMRSIRCASRPGWSSSRTRATSASR